MGSRPPSFASPRHPSAFNPPNILRLRRLHPFPAQFSDQGSNNSWTGFNPNAQPFVSKSSSSKGVPQSGLPESAHGEYPSPHQHQHHHHHHVQHMHHLHHQTHLPAAPAAHAHRYGIDSYPGTGEAPIPEYEPQMPVSDFGGEYSLPSHTRPSSFPSASSSAPQQHQHLSANLRADQHKAGPHALPILPPPEDKENEDKLEPRRSKSLLPDSGHDIRPMRPAGVFGEEAPARYPPRRKHVRQPCLVCGEESTLECSTCAQIRKRLGVNLRTFFCSTDHQMQVWKQHNEEVHTKYPLSGVPSLSKQKQMAVRNMERAESAKQNQLQETKSEDSAVGSEPEPKSGNCSESGREATGSNSIADAIGSNVEVPVVGESEGTFPDEASSSLISKDGPASPSSSGAFPTVASSGGDISSDSGFGGTGGLYDPTYCAPHFFNVPKDSPGVLPDLGHANGEPEADGPPMAETELESLGNSILNDLDDIIQPSFSLQNQGKVEDSAESRGAGEELVEERGTTQ